MREALGLVAAAALLVVGAMGCSTPIGVKQVDARQVHRALTASVLSTGEPSPFSVQVLQREGLQERFDSDPEGALAALRDVALEGEQRADALFALAELCFLHGERSGDRRYPLAAAVYAYAFLFPETGPQPGRFDPRLRLAADLYNLAVTRGLSIDDEPRLELASGTHPLPFGELVVRLDEPSLVWAGHRLEDFVAVANFEVRGLSPRYRLPGIGAPLVAKLGAGKFSKAAERRVSPRARIPVTAFLRIHEPLRAVAMGRVEADLELYAFDQKIAVDVGERRVPLESEPTAALAYELAQSTIWEFGLDAFLRGDFRLFADSPPDGLMMLTPYKPGLVPLVLVHGTLSSPVTWAAMLNELMHDPAVASHYQFWFFFYNTGNPILYSAGQLRQALQNATSELDPDGRDPALQRMVLVSHSQGGLLARLVVSSCGNRYWRSISSEPFEEAKMDATTRELLRRSLFFEPLPQVRSVVFISTPHRGSYVAGWSLAHLGASLTSLPLDVVGGISDLIERNPQQVALRELGDVANSVENMTPGSHFLQVLDTCPVSPTVEAHSIISVQGDGPVEQGNDGVVEYRSAHIDWARSEKVVHSGHSTLGHFETINEVRRILYERIAEDAGSPDATGAGAPEGRPGGAAAAETGAP